ncbi:MAG: Mur ligase domain-containing protein, partial [Saprospiraceae bacterium]
MMTIKELIVDIPVNEIRGDVNQAVESIQSDSRKVEPGSLFVAVKGRTTDGHKFIETAVDRGACCVIAEELDYYISERVCVIIVEDSASALAGIASAYYGHPSKELV